MTAASSPRPRLPDFVVIGTMKSGTTTLYRWLDEHPGTAMPSVKEPGFFSDDAAWRRGVDWYSSLFPPADGASITGEASVDYTDPARARVAAERMRSVVPDARLVCVLRNPVERMRSHYRHEVQRGRERDVFLAAIARSGNAYVARSLYYDCLEPYLEAFASGQLCVVRLDDVVAGTAEGWHRVLAHLGLDDRPPPGGAFNVTDEKDQFTRAMRWLWERGVVDRLSPRIRAQRVRRAARRLLLRRDERYRAQLATADAAVPADTLHAIWTSCARLESCLGSGELWPRATPGAPA